MTSDWHDDRESSTWKFVARSLTRALITISIHPPRFIHFVLFCFAISTMTMRISQKALTSSRYYAANLRHSVASTRLLNARLLSSDPSQKPEPPSAASAKSSEGNSKWFFGFVLVPCILLPAYFIQGDVKDVNSGRIQRKNTTWNGV
jgi:hypothetical protein